MMSYKRRALLLASSVMDIRCSRRRQKQDEKPKRPF